MASTSIFDIVISKFYYKKNYAQLSYLKLTKI